MSGQTLAWLIGAMVPALALGFALWLDHAFGEPPARWHPVVWIGRCLGALGRHVAPLAEAGGAPRALPFIAGTLAWCAGAAAVVAIAVVLERLARQMPPPAAALLLGVLLKPLLAWRMLREEVLAVEAALVESLGAGRTRLARLVSRDVQALTEAGVRESAIESLAENLNDSVVAPIFWFALLGLPGAALYRFANTADAMWGYRGERGGREWEWAGKWAARADDVLSWLPARITACLLTLSFVRRDEGGARASAARGWRQLRREAGLTPSPNSGWPMAAMALRLGVRLGKPRVYTLNAAGRTALAQDTQRAAKAGAWVVAGSALAAAAALVLGAAC
jgi:adenosylcobinamide-phosphate synthase